MRLSGQENPILLKEIEEYLNKGLKQRDIARLTKVSLVTVNKYCKKITNRFKIEEKEDRAKRREIKNRMMLVKRLKEVQQEVQKNPVSNEEIGENAKGLFNSLIVELRFRIPQMTNAELMQVTLDVWDKVK